MSSGALAKPGTEEHTSAQATARQVGAIARHQRIRERPVAALALAPDRSGAPE
jgi:hypothetical protein